MGDGAAARAGQRDYRHRDVVDKLGIRPGQAVAFHDDAGALDQALRARILERTGRAPAAGGELLDVVLLAVSATTDATTLLRAWQRRLHPAGAIWLLSPKRGQSGYVDQRALIAAGYATGLVDNKICSVSDTTSGLRFVFRREDRPRR
jgi:hypothetical protein